MGYLDPPDDLDYPEHCLACRADLEDLMIDAEEKLPLDEQHALALLTEQGACSEKCLPRVQEIWKEMADAENADAAAYAAEIEDNKRLLAQMEAEDRRVAREERENSTYDYAADDFAYDVARDRAFRR